MSEKFWKNYENAKIQIKKIIKNLKFHKKLLTFLEFRRAPWKRPPFALSEKPIPAISDQTDGSIAWTMALPGWHRNACCVPFCAGCSHTSRPSARRVAQRRLVGTRHGIRSKGIGIPGILCGFLYFLIFI